MILSDSEIQAAIQAGDILVDPLPGPGQFSTSALDLILGDQLYELKTPEELARDEPAGVERPIIIDVHRINFHEFAAKYTKPIPLDEQASLILPPRKFVLGSTREHVTLPREARIAARVEGRSTLARLGLAVHMTAPTIHAGFTGNIVLEMVNLSLYDLRLRPGQLAICQLIFERLGTAPSGQLQTAFQGQKGVRG